MSEEEMIEYLVSTGLYKDENGNLLAEWNRIFICVLKGE